MHNVGTATAARRGRTSERGAGTVLVLGCGLLLLILCAAVLMLLQTAVAAGRAATAADLAALAAADTVRALRIGDPCWVAGEVAGRNGAVLAACTVDAGKGTVQVETEVPVPLLNQPATGHARAGPPP
ncbi:secretion/DNA translocation related TadE-like protein [Arthrobacter sp. UYP6]|uniref:Rv3654c family TadE-like protein n=1 Tax=Arthrobacter sp. UYP6 TaxID=1756378 RepID=UPI00339A5A73